MHHNYTTPVPERLNQDLGKAHITVRYLNGQGQQCEVEFECLHTSNLFLALLAGTASRE